MNAIVLMAIGAKHQAICRERYTHYKNYADRCNADLVVCTEPLDPSNYRCILSQKLLIPQKYHNYEWIAFLDLDIFISDNAPSIFDYIDNNYAFAAVADPRGTDKFMKCALYYWRRPEIANETHESYFMSRGYEPHDNGYCSINGGVFLCKTAGTAELLSQYYYSSISEPYLLQTHEEGMMAYATQRNGLFYELDYKFNTIVTYEVYDQPDENLYHSITSTNFELLGTNKAYHLSFKNIFPSYVDLIDKLEKNSYFVHFTSNMPMIY